MQIIEKNGQSIVREIPRIERVCLEGIGPVKSNGENFTYKVDVNEFEFRFKGFSLARDFVAMVLLFNQNQTIYLSGVNQENRFNKLTVE